MKIRKVIDKMSESQQNAERIKRYQERMAAVERTTTDCTEENLWNCIIARMHWRRKEWYLLVLRTSRMFEG